MDYNANRLIEILRSGEKKENQFKIGVEFEHFVVDKNSWNSINYYQENGIETILKKLMKFDYIPLYEEDYLIGLAKEEAVITLEPGGQLEISIKACNSLQEINSIYWNFLREIIPILEEQNQFLLALGYHPKSKIDEVPFIPKKRYQLMSAYFKGKGKYAQNMMKGTSALQISIDYRDEEDFAKKLKVANFIYPLLAIISDNSPVFEGEVYQQSMLRTLIWQNLDDTRSGTIPEIMDKPFSYQKYAEYILNLEPILFIKDNHMIDAGSMKSASVLEQYALTHNELVHFFSMAFPVARARTYIEIRPGDSLPYPFNFSYIALIKGLFYNDVALDYLFRLTSTIDSNMFEKHEITMVQNGFNSEFGSKTIMEFLPHLFDLAREGLPAEEKNYLQPLEKLILSRKNVSDIAKEKLAKEGFSGLRAWTLNDWLLEESFMSTRALFDQYREQVLANPSKYIESYKSVFQEVQHSVAKYRGQPISFLYQPMFQTKTDMQLFNQLTQQLYSILDKVIKHYLEDEKFRGHFGFPPLLEELILKDPGYKMDIPKGRFDIFYDFDSGRVQFCELNTDGSTGMQQQQELARIFKQSSAILEFGKEQDVHDFELFDSWVMVVQGKYAEFSKSTTLPQIAIIDWLEAIIPTEFIEFQKAFERAGCKTVIADPRWLEYRDGNLYYHDFRIDCIYRRAVTFEIIERADSVKDFINAYLNGDVCVVGPLRSQIAHNKIIFALLHDQNKTPFLTGEERRFVKEHIPFTAIFDINNPDLVNYAIKNKDILVLKPMDKYASTGVRIGKDYSADEWFAIMLEEAKEEYILQEFCKVPTVPMAYFNEEKVEFIDTGYIFGLFIYNGIFQGIYTRVGTTNNIGGAECFKVPNFVLSHL